MNKLVGKLLMVGSLFLAGCGKDEGFTFEEQLAIDIAKIDQYLETNEIDAEVHNSGIRFVETESGSDRSPGIGDVAVTIYDFKVLGRDEIAGSSEYGDSFTIDANLLRALYFMLQEMQVGGKMKIYAPSGYGFGQASNSVIPANSNLVFNLELVSVVRNETEQLAADTTVIENYLDANEIESQVHISGIRYTVNLEGEGESPAAGASVTVVYQGRFLNGDIFSQSEDGVNFNLSGLIKAWQIMIPTMKTGGNITIYAPSGLGYGTTGNGSIPPNTNLIFDIELISIQ